MPNQRRTCFHPNPILTVKEPQRPPSACSAAWLSSALFSAPSPISASPSVAASRTCYSPGSGAWQPFVQSALALCRWVDTVLAQANSRPQSKRRTIRKRRLFSYGLRDRIVGTQYSPGVAGVRDARYDEAYPEHRSFTMRFVRLSTVIPLILVGTLALLGRMAAAQNVTYEKGSILDIQPKPGSSPVHKA